MKKIHPAVLALLFFIPLTSIFPQGLPPGLGMEPTPKNFDGSIRAATARAGKTSIPPQVDLSSFFPAPGFQGEQNSCVAWATAYAAKTYQENAQRGWGTESAGTIFSPSYIYNQINQGRDEGSTIPDAMELIRAQGVATLKSMPYGDFRIQPSPTARQEAARFRAESYARLDGKNIDALKILLADGHPIIVGMKTYENFLTHKSGVYRRAAGSYLGGHAMVVVGYDDGKSAFKIINSWGEGWGEGGFVYYDYILFAELHHTAMVMYGMPANTPEKSYPPNTVSASGGTYQDRIQISWEGVKSADYYLVYRAEKSPVDFYKTAEVKGTAFIDTQVAPGTDYFYSVKSVGSGGESDFSSVARGYLRIAAELGTPKNLQGLLDKGLIKLIWDPVDGAEGYNIYRWDGTIQQWQLLGSSRNQGFQDTRIPPDSRQERYIVTAYAGNRESKAAEGLTVAIPPPAVTQAPEPPAVPEGVQASRGNFTNKIEVSWSAVPGAESYILRRWSRQKGQWEVLYRGQRSFFADIRLAERSNLYTVLAVQKGLESEPSAIAEGSVKSAPPKKVPPSFADDDYRSDFDRRAERFFGDDSFFSDDSFFTGEARFFDDFEEENFFFFDQEAFFRFDEETFFDKEDRFFDDKNKFSDKEDDFFGGGGQNFF